MLESQGLLLDPPFLGRMYFQEVLEIRFKIIRQGIYVARRSNSVYFCTHDIIVLCCLTAKPVARLN